MFELLVVEDQVDFYENYLVRIFEQLLPMEDIHLTHAPTIASALEVLGEPWDAILMDYALGEQAIFMDKPVRDGAGLVAVRRGLEEDLVLKQAFILGISSHQVGNRLMHDSGASSYELKLHVGNMADKVRAAIWSAEIATMSAKKTLEAKEEEL